MHLWGKFHLDQWKVLMSTLMAGRTVVTQFAMEGRERGELREESAQCRGSLSGMDYRDARPGLVLGSGGRPGLEGEPRVQKWPIGPILTQRGLSLDHRSAAARDSHWGRQSTKGRLTHTHTHTGTVNTHILGKTEGHSGTYCCCIPQKLPKFVPFYNFLTTKG